MPKLFVAGLGFENKTCTNLDWTSLYAGWIGVQPKGEPNLNLSQIRLNPICY